MSEKIIAMKLLSKLNNSKGRLELDNLIETIKDSRLNENNCDIYIVSKIHTKNPEIININWLDAVNKKYVEDFENIIVKNILQPQMISNLKHYIPIYDNDFSFNGKIIKKSNLVHFFLSKNKTSDKIQILVQKGKTGFLADKFISNNGKKFYDI